MRRRPVSLWSCFRPRTCEAQSEFVGVFADGAGASVKLSGDFVEAESLFVELFELIFLLFVELFHCCLRAGAFAKAVLAASEIVEWFVSDMAGQVKN